MTYACPKGHVSADEDYCSECGTPIGAASVAVALSTPAPHPPDACPVCSTARTPDMRFCEVCRHDYEQTTAAPVVAAAPPAAPLAPLVSTLVTDVPLAPRLMLLVTAEASLYSAPDPDIPFPVNAPERVFHLDLSEHLIGRTSRSRHIFPEIPLDDVGASGRHLKVFETQEGWQAMDLGSSNGTRYNGNALPAHVPVLLKAGDELTLGMWTRIRVAAR